MFLMLLAAGGIYLVRPDVQELRIASRDVVHG
jgi:hypothetical protein